MKKIIFPFIVCIFIQCSDDNDTLLTPGSCVGESQIPFGGLPACDDAGVAMYLCEVKAVGNFKLDPSSKEFMPLFCYSTGKTFVYQNLSGDEIALKLTHKSNTKSVSTYNTFRHCPSDSTRHIGYCIITDRPVYILESESKGLELMINLQTIPDINILVVGNVGDILEIHRNKGNGSYSLDFTAIVEQRTLSYSKTSKQEFYPEFELAGTRYPNVISNDVSRYSPKIFKYFYNNVIGLIAFRDTTGNTWTLKM